MFRVGFGYDVHAMKKGHPFMIGGIQIEHHSGAFGHSDADILLHAICDALLGAIAKGDLGAHFPDNDPSFKGIDSKLLLKQVVDLVKQEGYKIANIDSTICLQQPKLRPFIDKIRASTAEVMGLDISQVSVKATTTERLGFVGREEGVSCYAVALVTQMT